MESQSLELLFLTAGLCTRAEADTARHVVSMGQLFDRMLTPWGGSALRIGPAFIH